MASDPLAVTMFDLDALPAASGPARPAGMQTFTRIGGVSFADVWMAHLGGQAMAERHVRLALGPTAKRANEQYIDLVAGTSTILPVPDHGDVLAARLGLRTLIHRRARTGQHNLPMNLMAALVHGLDIETIWTKRNRMWDATRTERTLRGRTNRGRPLSKTDIVASVAGWQGTSKASVWNTLALDLSTNHAKGHASDAWFEAGKQDEVAAELTRRFRSGEADQRTRWDLYNLMEGFYARRLFPSDHTLVALDHALGLVDRNGPVEHTKPMRGVKGAAPAYSAIPLGGVSRRREFMLVAGIAAGVVDEIDLDDVDLPARAGRDRWGEMPIFATALALLSGD